MKINTRPVQRFTFNNRIVRYILLSFLFLILFILQTVPGCFPRIGKIAAYLMIPGVVSVASQGGEIDGAILGAAAGVLWDSVSPEVAGYHMLMLVLVGCICGLALKYSLRNNFVSVLFLSAVSLVVYTVIYWFFFLAMRGHVGSWVTLIYVYLPSDAYTLVMFIPIYFLVKLIYKLGSEREAGVKKLKYNIK